LSPAVLQVHTAVDFQIVHHIRLLAEPDFVTNLEMENPKPNG
jgi:hypothetical protein